MSGTVHIIDGSGYIFRAFYSMRAMSTSTGEPTNATYGFANMIRKVLEDEKPEYVAITFDKGRHTFRSKLYPEYKANRPPAPEDLVPQIPRIHEVAESFDLPIFMADEYEADDFIATLAKKSVELGKDVHIITGDKDLMQLVTDKVTIFDPMKDKRIGIKEVTEKFGVPPERVIDALALAGDSSDNVPGVRGVGPKTATRLLKEYDSVEGVLEAAKDGKIKGKICEKIAASVDEALMSKKLVTLVDDVELEFDLEKLKYNGPNVEAQRKLFTELEFRRLIPDGPVAEIPGTPAPAPAVAQPIDRTNYRIVTTPVELVQVRDALLESGRFSIEVELSSTRLVDAELIAIAVSHRNGEVAYLPVGHEYEDCPGQLGPEAVIKAFAPLLEDPELPKISASSKALHSVLERFDVELRGLSLDAMLGSYLLDPDELNHDAPTIARRHLGLEPTRRETVVGRGKDKRAFAQLTLEEGKKLLGELADISFRAEQVLAPGLAEAELENVLTDIELPLVPVLARVEEAGLLLDLRLIKELSAVFQNDLTVVEKKVYEAAGKDFNIGSPKQLQKILYEELGLKIIKRTKTGPSTDASVLEELADEHPLPKLVLEYRQLAKLKSTYIDALPKMVCPATGRVHTSLSQTTAATGRLSSRDPNLQNIPIRSDIGGQLRKIFIAGEGRSLVSVDYSQIELRVLAHLSEEPVLLEAFRNEEDIHTRTASVLFEIEPSEVTREQRTQAKAVNFGVLYGMGPARLARQLQIPRRTASQFVKDYFTRQPQVQRLIDQTLDTAKETGVVRTLLGRRRIVKDINSRNRGLRSGAERIATNTPIQGSAADLIKLAMIRVAARLEDSPDVKLLLQVHDELLLEAPDGQAEEVAQMVKREMEHVFPMHVPMTAEAHVGKNWGEAH